MIVFESTELQIKRVAWRSSSNIAIVKYWGKKGIQQPLNPSISFTLKKSFTETSVSITSLADKQSDYFTFFFNNQPLPSFELKLKQFFGHVFELYPTLVNYHFNINSTNSFPHSAGIASSASAISALAACIVDIKKLIDNTSAEDAMRLSYLARLGSGSASRSVYGGWSLWGQHSGIIDSSNQYAISINELIHSDFKKIRDTILIINPGQKQVSSSQGHQLMQHHPYREARIAQAHKNIDKLTSSLRNGDWQAFSEVAEAEALSLHAMMMSSNRGYFLMKANTMKAIERIRQFRIDTGIPVCFTLDAGPNVHLLYAEKDETNVIKFIYESLLPLCDNNRCIFDQIGNGPEKIS